VAPLVVAVFLAWSRGFQDADTKIQESSRWIQDLLQIQGKERKKTKGLHRALNRLKSWKKGTQGTIDSAIAQLQQDLAAMETAKQVVEADLKSERAAKGQLRQQSESLEHSKKKTEAELKSEREANKKLRSEVDDMKSAKKIVDASLRSERSRNDNLTTEVTKLKSSKDSIKARLEEAQKLSDEQKGQLRDLAKSKKATEVEPQSTQAETSRLTAKFADLERSTGTIAADLKSEREKSSRLESQISALEKSKQAAELNVQSTKAENNHPATQFANLESTKQNFEADLESGRHTTSHLSAKVAALESSTQTLEAELDSMRAKAGHLRSEVEGLKSSNRSLNNELKAEWAKTDHYRTQVTNLELEKHIIASEHEGAEESQQTSADYPWDPIFTKPIVQLPQPKEETANGQSPLDQNANPNEPTMFSGSVRAHHSGSAASTVELGNENPQTVVEFLWDPIFPKDVVQLTPNLLAVLQSSEQQLFNTSSHWQANGPPGSFARIDKFIAVEDKLLATMAKTRDRQVWIEAVKRYLDGVSNEGETIETYEKTLAEETHVSMQLLQARDKLKSVKAQSRAWALWVRAQAQGDAAARQQLDGMVIQTENQIASAEGGFSAAKTAYHRKRKEANTCKTDMAWARTHPSEALGLPTTKGLVSLIRRNVIKIAAAKRELERRTIKLRESRDALFTYARSTL
jgi:predicted  nucleic acid-binding Zn-ribbon protein